MTEAIEKWIDVNKRLPKLGILVYVAVDNETVKGVFVSKNKPYWCWNEWSTNILYPTHWQYIPKLPPLPKPPVERFVCDDCSRELSINQKCSSEYNICKDCLDNYENKTGYCSISCRISGVCDESC